jgi:xanthine dehydrogenase accessory factor
MDIYKEIYNRKNSGQSFILATIIQTKGASPRQTGAKMMVLPDGSIVGTIGGGIFEKQIIDDCLTLFKSEENHLLKRYNFSDKGPDAIGMTCGGEATVFMEVSSRPNDLYIFGGGHVCREICHLAKGSGFAITVIDDRRDILDQYVEPVNTILTDDKYKKNFPELDDNSYVIVVTKNHKCDQPVMEQAVKRDCAYIGMIGSQAKVKKILGELKKSGAKQRQLIKIHAPIGLDIGGEGPYEIAVSIMAEIIAVTHNKPVK